MKLRRREVEAAYRRCLEIDARIYFPPEGDEDKYELFVFDPDGIRVEVGCAGRRGAVSL